MRDLSDFFLSLQNGQVRDLSECATFKSESLPYHKAPQIYEFRDGSYLFLLFRTLPYVTNPVGFGGFYNASVILLLFKKGGK